MSIPAIVRRFREQVGRYGLIGIGHRLALRTVNRFVKLRVLRCVVLEGDPTISAEATGYRHGFIDPDHLLALAEDPANDMTPAYVREAIEEGDACYGIFDGDVLASYGWYLRKPYGRYSRKPTGKPDDLVLYFDPSHAYMHKGFTREGYRGRRLHAFGMAAACQRYRLDGLRGLVSLVASDNFDSLRSCARLGFRTFGTIVVLRAFGRAVMWMSQGCRTYGMALERRRPQTRSEAAVPALV